MAQGNQHGRDVADCLDAGGRGKRQSHYAIEALEQAFLK
jgi:hypothetical protein